MGFRVEGLGFRVLTVRYVAFPNRVPLLYRILVKEIPPRPPPEKGTPVLRQAQTYSCKTELFGVSGLGFRGFGFRVSDLGFRSRRLFTLSLPSPLQFDFKIEGQAKESPPPPPDL